jgi:2-hydroxycyclohexanecarboxyl-CoA dehydrogenase
VPDTGRLVGKVALITGAAGGIGQATTELFCREGAAVALVGSHQETLDAAADTIARAVPGARLLPVAADGARFDQVQNAVDQTIRQFGELTTLVNNAAVREYYRLADAPEESWARILGVNVMGVANCSRAALPALRKARGASIVNVSSVFGVVPRKGMGQYDATKGAMQAQTRVLAAEEAQYGVRVNVVCPGSTLTPFTRGRAAARGMTEAELVERGAVPSMLGRWADPMEVAYPILWLASDEASYITATALMVDGGMPVV